MNSRKNMRKWQMIVLVGLCVLVSLSMFLPLFSITGEKMLGSAEEIIDEFADTLGVGNLLDNYEKKLDDKKEEIDSQIEKISEKVGIDLSSISAFDIITLDKYQLFLGKDYNEEDVEKYEEEKEKLKDVENENEKTAKKVIYELENQLTKFKVFLISLYFGILLIALIIILCFAFKRSKYLPSIVTMIFNLIGMTGMLYLRYGVPGKLMAAENIFGNQKNELMKYKILMPQLEEFMKSFLKTMWGNIIGIGFWITIIVMLLLIVMSVLTMILRGSESDAMEPVVNSTPIQPEPIMSQDIPTQPVAQPVPNYANQKPAELVFGNTPVMPAQKPMGRVKCTAGVALGQGFKLPEDRKVIVGKSPKSATLVINNPHVSNVHCSIRYQASSNTYIIKDHSSNGTFANGVRLQKDVPMTFPAGTIISLADGTNQITLG